MLLRQRVQPSGEARDLLDQMLTQQSCCWIKPNEQRRCISAHSGRVLTFLRRVDQRGSKPVRRKVKQGAGIGQRLSPVAM